MNTIVNNPNFNIDPTTNPIDTLRAMTDNDFAASLVRQFDERGSLSPKQWFWVEKLATEANAVAPVATADMSKLVALMHRAKTNLKWPKLRFETNAGPVVIKVLGDRSRTPGALRINDGGPFKQDRWFGNISVDGELSPSKTCPQEVVDLLEKVADNPAKALAELGHSTGHCNMCNAPLTDARSKTAGFGKTCAKNFGLPWGEVADFA